MADLATRELRKRVLRGTVVAVLSLGLITTAALFWFFSAKISLVTVRGESMEPTYKAGQILLVNQASSVEKDMLVIFPKPESWEYMGDQQPELIKRIVAGGGSTVEYDEGRVYVDGEVVYELEKEGYDCSLPEGYSHKLSGDELFVLGDNHKKSLDSLRILCDGKGDEAYVKFSTVSTYGKIGGTF